MRAAAELHNLTSSLSADAHKLWSRMVVKALRREVQIDVIEDEVAAARELCEAGMAERSGGILGDAGGHIVMSRKVPDLVEKASQ